MRAIFIFLELKIRFFFLKNPFNTTVQFFFLFDACCLCVLACWVLLRFHVYLEVMQTKKIPLFVFITLWLVIQFQIQLSCEVTVIVWNSFLAQILKIADF